LVFEHGLEKVEEIRRRLEENLEGLLNGTSTPSSGLPVAVFRFLTKYAINLSEPNLEARLRSGLRILAESPQFDSVEGGFFEAESDTRKRLSTNAGWFVVALRLRRPGQGDFAGLLARGILRYLHSRLLLPDGSFAAEQGSDADYYALDIHQRRLLSPPPTRSIASPLACAVAAQAFAKAYQSLGEPVYREVAYRALQHSAEGAASRPGGEGPSLSLSSEQGLASLSLYNSTLDPAFLDMARRLAEGLERRGTGESSPEVLSRGATFLLLASAQLQDDCLGLGARRLVDRILGGRAETPEDLAHVGHALLSMLLPLALFTAVTDGSQGQREKVLDQIRTFRAPYATLVHRPPTAAEAMQALPRLFSQCGGRSREIPLVPLPG
jgi:hypothetical protein